MSPTPYSSTTQSTICPTYFFLTPRTQHIYRSNA
jgi:hypothetical protein